MSEVPLSAKRPNLDSVTTINADGSHHILHPSDVSGRFTTARKVVAALLIGVYVSLPWIPVNGAPAVFFDVEMRRFHFMGLTLMPQDLWVMFFAVSGMGFLLFVVTAVLGRIWCGWACPYTVFLDHMFRRVERWIDGDQHARRRLAAAPWSPVKMWKRILKHTIYIIMSALIANVFLSYFVSIPRLYGFMKSSPLDHLTAFGVMLFVCGAIYYCFAWFREQFCIIMCPYGRLQSAMTDDDTMIIGYDVKRGEPRGKTTNPDAGDCVSCNRCVSVCPTGIDIREGLQMECIGCAACIDACDDIMTKVHRPKGLIRYDSMRGLAGKKRRVLRPRLYAYLALGLLGTTVLGVTAFYRAKPMHAEMSRLRGPSFYVDPTLVRNIFQIRLQNKRNQPMTFQISLENPPKGYLITGLADAFVLPPLDEIARPLVIIVPREDYTGPVKLTLRIHSNPGDTIVRQEVEFLGPNPQILK